MISGETGLCNSRQNLFVIQQVLKPALLKWTTAHALILEYHLLERIQWSWRKGAIILYLHRSPGQHGGGILIFVRS